MQSTGVQSPQTSPPECDFEGVAKAIIRTADLLWLLLSSQRHRPSSTNSIQGPDVNNLLQNLCEALREILGAIKCGLQGINDAVESSSTYHPMYRTPYLQETLPGVLSQSHRSINEACERLNTAVVRIQQFQKTRWALRPPPGYPVLTSHDSMASRSVGASVESYRPPRSPTSDPIMDILHDLMARLKTLVEMWRWFKLASDGLQVQSNLSWSVNFFYSSLWTMKAECDNAFRLNPDRFAMVDGLPLPRPAATQHSAPHLPMSHSQAPSTSSVVNDWIDSRDPQHDRHGGNLKRFRTF